MNGGFIRGGVVWICLLSAAWGHGAEAVYVEGDTAPFVEVTIGAPVAGTIATMAVKEGAEVKRGQSILVFDDAIERLEVRRRQVQLESTSELKAAKAAEATLKADLEGLEKLFQRTSSVSKEDLAKKRLEFETAVAERLRLEAVETREKIELELAKEQLALRTIKAPIDGTVVELHKERGESCRAQDDLLSIVDVRKFYFIANVDAKTGYRLKVGQEVRLEVEVGEGKATMAGRLDYVAPVVHAGSGLMRVKALFENPGRKVRPGSEGRLLLPAL